MSVFRQYEIMILLPEELNDHKLKRWVVNYTKNVRQFSICDISIISHGKQNLSYPIKNRSKGNYIQLNFVSLPKYIKSFSKILAMDSSVIRFSIFNRYL